MAIQLNKTKIFSYLWTIYSTRHLSPVGTFSAEENVLQEECLQRNKNLASKVARKYLGVEYLSIILSMDYAGHWEFAPQGLTLPGQVQWQHMVLLQTAPELWAHSH